MNPSLFPLLEIVKLNSGLFEKALRDLDRAALVGRVVEHSNPILWIAGHLTWSRYGMAGFLGSNLAFPLPPVFAKGAAVGDEGTLLQADAVLSA